MNFKIWLAQFSGQNYANQEVYMALSMARKAEFYQIWAEKIKADKVHNSKITPGNLASVLVLLDLVYIQKC